MKRILTILLLSIAVIFSLGSRTVENPKVQKTVLPGINYWDIPLKINGIDFYNDSTRVRMSANGPGGREIIISKNPYIRIGPNSYSLIRANGIVPGELKAIPRSGILEFDLVFKKVPMGAKNMDLLVADKYKFLGVYIGDPVKREQFFSEFADDRNFEYTFLSPLMVKTLSSKEVHNIPVNKYNHLEMLTTESKGEDSKLQNTIQDVISINMMELISKDNKRSGESVAEFYGTWNESRKHFEKLLLLQYGKNRKSLRILLMSGNFKIDDLRVFTHSVAGK